VFWSEDEAKACWLSWKSVRQDLPEDDFCPAGSLVPARAVLEKEGRSSLPYIYAPSKSSCIYYRWWPRHRPGHCLASAERAQPVALAARTRAQVDSVAAEVAAEFGRRDRWPSNATWRIPQKAYRAVCADDVKSLGRGPDILVNNAGIAETAPFLKTDERLATHLEVKSDRGPFAARRAALPGMPRTELGPHHQYRFDCGQDGRAYIRGVLGRQSTASSA